MLVVSCTCLGLIVCQTPRHLGSRPRRQRSGVWGCAEAGVCVVVWGIQCNERYNVQVCRHEARDVKKLKFKKKKGNTSIKPEPTSQRSVFGLFLAYSQAASTSATRHRCPRPGPLLWPRWTLTCPTPRRTMGSHQVQPRPDRFHFPRFVDVVFNICQHIMQLFAGLVLTTQPSDWRHLPAISHR